MGCCASSTSTQDTLIGGRVVGTTPPPFGVTWAQESRLIDVPIGTVVCFDNGSKKKSMMAVALEADGKKLRENIGAKLLDNILPRVGVIWNELGVVKPIVHGNASVLDAIDLECISQVFGNTYVATSSNGNTHVFSLSYNFPTCVDYGFLYAEHIAQGHLPSPPGAGEIEATAVFRNDKSELMMLWTGRGGDSLKESWTRQAPFDYMTGGVDELKIELGRMVGVTGNPKWRTASSMQVHVNWPVVEFWFTSVYDGTESDGKVLTAEMDQTSPEAKAAFKSVLAKTTFGMGPSTTDIIAQYEGIKVEAILLLTDSGDNKVKAVLLGSDDEIMGSLLGVQPLQEAKIAGVGNFGLNAGTPKFVNLAENSMYETFIPKSKFGTSGFALAGSFASAIINGGRV